MKLQHALLASALAFTGAAAVAATNVGVTVDISQPGVYGRLSFGNPPPPTVLMYPQPVIYAPARVVVPQQPIYLYVPPGHAKDWGKHCSKYNACAQPVYFVRDEWVRDEYARRHPGDARAGYREGYRDGVRAGERDDDRGRGKGEGRGKGHGNGKGHGKHD